MYDIKALYEATSVPHAIELLLAHPEAKIIAGGSDVLVQMREGRLAGCELVSIYGLDELRGVTLEADGTIRIGSLTSFSHITKDLIIQRHIRVLGEAVDQVGGPQIRNIGTIGGNTCNGVTSADSASTLFAWDAEVELTGPDGVRLLPIQAFYIKAGKVDLRPGELQTAILIRRASYGTAIEDARIAYGVAGPVPMRAPSAEAAVRGKPVEEATVEAFGKAALMDVNPRTSWRASREFRLQLVEELAKRALRESIRLSGGKI